ncbi:MAG: SPASM domain-containing protein [Candidatus Tenebribacter burtonii]|jgi:radical SAM protein with 4Fe4S-binding SPASM domain|nr:SPASM domain-containing protein [Candidatus Tenebribacter burtonii]
MSKLIKRIINTLKLFRKLEISRRNLGFTFITYYIYNIRINIIRKFVLRRQFKKGWFVSTNLETYGYCNRECDFCFNNKRFTQRKKGEMPIKLWEKIINELSEMNFAGRISPHFYGEPLMDKRLPDLIHYARRSCKNSYISLFTNGDFLSEDLFVKLIRAGVNIFLITNYEDLENRHFEFLRNKYPGHVILRSYKDFKKTNRAGELFDEKKLLTTPCLRPASQLVINWDGSILLCCMDYYAKETFGNINTQSIKDIWSSKEFINKRELLRLGKRASIPICKYCDDSGNIPW